MSYKYTWTLVEHSIIGGSGTNGVGSEDFGNMEGTSSNNLKLSNLKAGNYTFKVVVTAENAIGQCIPLHYILL